MLIEMESVIPTGVREYGSVIPNTAGIRPQAARFAEQQGFQIQQRAPTRTRMAHPGRGFRHG